MGVTLVGVLRVASSCLAKGNGPCPVASTSRAASSTAGDTGEPVTNSPSRRTTSSRAAGSGPVSSS